MLEHKEIEICGWVEVPVDVSEDEFYDKFIEFIEKNGWYFGGGFKTIIDDYYINSDGTRGKHISED